MQIFKPLF